MERVKQKEKVTLTLDSVILKDVDEIRGLATRSAVINNILQTAFGYIE
jgi:metal-responsive CopG/Arc/MetJ family transcriptional regulator